MPVFMDYSYARPTVDQIKAADATTVIRYLSGGTSAKDLTAAEAKILLDADIGILLIWETSAARAGAGAAAGEEDRKRAEGQANLLGYPPDVPIFMAVDYDAAPAAVVPYFEGAQRAASRPTGVYGGVRIIDALVGQHGVTFGWQTTSWSGGAVSAKAHLLQNQRYPNWDLNRILKPIRNWRKIVAPPLPTGERVPVEDGRFVSVLVDGKVTVPYGAKLTNPATGKSYWMAGYHPGDDWNAPGNDHGIPVLAPVEGVVVAAKRNAWPIDAYGLQVVIQDATGERTACCHLNSIEIQHGAYVHAGDLIGTNGATGTGAHGDHCHVERRHSRFGYWDHERPLYDYPRPKTSAIRVDELVTGSRCASVYWVQRALNRVSLDGGRELRLSGRFDKALGDEIARFQIQKCGDPGDRLLGPKQTAKLLELSGLQGVTLA